MNYKIEPAIFFLTRNTFKLKATIIFGTIFIIMSAGQSNIELIAVLVAVNNSTPKVMTVNAGKALPSGPFELKHDSLQAGLRDWVGQQTGHPIGFLEQLYTFADRNRIPEMSDKRTISIGYLGLVLENAGYSPKIEWHDWYEHFPWDDCRHSKHPCVEKIIDALMEWSEKDPANKEARRKRTAFLFGVDGYKWNEDYILQRYELLYEAGLIAEAGGNLDAGVPMFADHRRILATAISRLRTNIKYKAIVFELMPEKFTLLQLQQAVEAIIGRRLHKPNFRRMTEQQGVIEETGERERDTGGRPAKLYRYRQEILEAHEISGSKLPIARY